MKSISLSALCFVSCLCLTGLSRAQQYTILDNAEIEAAAGANEAEEEDIYVPDEEDNAEEIPEWLAELSNLPRQQREEYIAHFTLAKQALAQGDWVVCDTALNSCDLIFNGNPNIHNLRVVCYIEQHRMEAATQEMERAKEALPQDPTTLVNMATLHMAKQEYRDCIKEMTAILDSPKYDISSEVRNILTFRVFLCYLMLGEVNNAQDLVADLSPLSDTPLFYYSRAAICLYLKDAVGARNDLQSAATIFSSAGMLTPYQRALLSCDLSQAAH